MSPLSGNYQQPFLVSEYCLFPVVTVSKLNPQTRIHKEAEQRITKYLKITMKGEMQQQELTPEETVNRAIRKRVGKKYTNLRSIQKAVCVHGKGIKLEIRSSSPSSIMTTSCCCCLLTVERNSKPKDIFSLFEPWFRGHRSKISKD